MNDLWELDLVTSKWKLYPNYGKVPEPRASSILNAFGFSLYLYGGEGTQGIISGSYSYSLITKTWEEMQVDYRVFVRKSSCVIETDNFLISFGGQTATGLSSELWIIMYYSNIATLMKPFGELPPHLKDFVCYAENLDDDVIFTVYGGFTFGNRSLASVYQYSFAANTWRRLFRENDDVFNVAAAAGAFTGNNLVAAGGLIGILSASSNIAEFDFKTNQFRVIGQLPHFIYNSGYIYVGSSLYVFFGGSSIGNKIVSDQAQFDILRIELNEDCDDCNALCSPGTYKLEGKCVLCPPGTYGSKFGGDCVLCPAGTFSSKYGVQGDFLCIPCPEGSYSNEAGSLFCKDCSDSEICPIGSSSGVGGQLQFVTSSSIQPEQYKDNQTDFHLNYAILAIICVGLVALSVLTAKKDSKGSPLIIRLDIFTEAHNHIRHSPMYIMPTLLGGVFSWLYFICGLCLTVTAVFNFINVNIEENKSLLPYEVLKEDIEEFSADIEVSLKALSYMDVCSRSDIEVTASNLKYLQSEVQANKLNNACIITFRCVKCTVGTGALVEIVINEANSQSSILMANVTATSSIPNQISSVTQFLKAPSGETFKGFVASIFKFDTTSSVGPKQYYEADIIDDGSDSETGYHITTPSLPIAGSSVSNYK